MIQELEVSANHFSTISGWSLAISTFPDSISSIAQNFASDASSPPTGIWVESTVNSYTMLTTCLRSSLSGSPITISSFGLTPSSPASSFSSRITACSGSSPLSTNPPGSTHEPGFGGYFLRTNRIESCLRTAASTASAGLR